MGQSADSAVRFIDKVVVLYSASSFSLSFILIYLLNSQVIEIFETISLKNADILTSCDISFICRMFACELKTFMLKVCSLNSGHIK